MSVQTNKSNKPEHGTVVYNQVSNKLQAYDGHSFKWVYIDESVTLTYCSLCKREFFDHTNSYTVMDHPFFKDNLEWLEWKYEATRKGL